MYVLVPSQVAQGGGGLFLSILCFSYSLSIFWRRSESVVMIYLDER